MSRKLLSVVCMVVYVFSFSTAFADDIVASSTPDTIAVVPVPNPVTITLDIEASAALYNKTITVSACPPAADSPASTVSGYCAVQQSGLNNNWS